MSEVLLSPRELRRRRRRELVPAVARRAPAPGVVGFQRNARNRGDGAVLLGALAADSVPLVVFDPQYRDVLDHLEFGNEGARQQARAALPQMGPDLVAAWMREIARVLRPSGHLLLWVDKFILAEGRYGVPGINRVDVICWPKPAIGMGVRTRRKSEYLVVLQKPPLRAKGVWTDHAIADVWDEPRGWEREYLPWPVAAGPHRKPVSLQARLIGAVTRPGDLVVDPCAGSYSVMDAAWYAGRDFLGTDLGG